MPGKCKVCASPDRAAVDSSLIAGASLRDIARQFPPLTKDSVGRHQKSCVVETITKAAEQKQLALGDRLLSEMDELHAATRALLKVATTEQTSDPRIALRAIGEARRNLSLVARMVGRLDPQQDQDKEDGRLTTWEQVQELYRTRVQSAPKTKGPKK
jgi:hypothetical protein